MNLNEILNEGTNHPVIVIDVQPAYSSAFSFQYQLANFLNRRTGNVWMMFNGNEYDAFTDDSLYDVQSWWLEDNGLDEEQMMNFEWTDKGYGFFRSWMDLGASTAGIIKTVREMLRQGVNDSRGLFDGDNDELMNFLGDEWDDYMIDDAIHLPDTLPADRLKQYSGAYICGGGNDQCFREVLIWMSVFNIKYKIMEKFVY